MKVAIFGGAFNPPHIGHYWVSRQVIELLEFDEVWLMPCKNHAFGKKMIDARHRLKMTSFIANKKIKVSDFEIQQKAEVTVTINTLRELSAEFSEHKFQFVMGSDNISTFHLWDEWEAIIKEFGLIIFPRGKSSDEVHEQVIKSFKDKLLLQNIIVLKGEDLVITNISSSLIKSRVKEDKSIKFLVPEEIEEYIGSNSLYIARKIRTRIKVGTPQSRETDRDK